MKSQKQRSAEYRQRNYMRMKIFRKISYLKKTNASFDLLNKWYDILDKNPVKAIYHYD